MKLKLLTLSVMLCAGSIAACAWDTPASQMEKLTRGVVAVKNSNGNGNFISWRFFGTDDVNTTTFNVLRDGSVIKEGIANTTYFVDETGGTHQYQIQTVVGGNVVATSDAVTSVDDYVLRVPLSRPARGNNVSGSYAYSPNDCSVGDVDGDGEYEIIVKWDPTDSQDNSLPGFTGDVYLDCYKFNGTKLWRIDLGKNIRAGAHYTQFLVYDFDGDGKAEVICKTAPGSTDGAGHFVTAAADDSGITGADNTADYRNTNDKTNTKGGRYGHVIDGPEYLTVFNGETGAAVNTVFYNPNRAGTLGGAPSGSSKTIWGDSFGNRCDRFLTTVAYLGGKDKHPSAVICRGYYTRAYLWAVDFDGKKLKTRWLHASVSSKNVELTDSLGTKTTKTYTTNTSGKATSYTAYGNGNHNLSVADVDEDGCDEIIYGGSAIDNDGSLLYATGFGHGDAMHLSDLVPDRKGLEVFTVHEDKAVGYGYDVHDARTGEIIFSATGSTDNGRGMAGDIVASSRGQEFWSSNDRQPRSAADGTVVSTKSVSVNFRAYWDGDAQDELVDGASISKYDETAKSVTAFSVGGKSISDWGVNSCNSTKKTPNLLADIFGDWREELVTWGSDSSSLVIFTSTIPTSYRVPTLMHDHTYRMAVAWQNSAYNQPPHLGFYLPDYISTLPTGIETVNNDGSMRIEGNVTDRLTLSANGGMVFVNICSADGRQVYGHTFDTSATPRVDITAIDNLTRGLYILRASCGANTLVKKIVKK